MTGTDRRGILSRLASLDDPAAVADMLRVRLGRVAKAGLDDFTDKDIEAFGRRQAARRAATAAACPDNDDPEPGPGFRP